MVRFNSQKYKKRRRQRNQATKIDRQLQWPPIKGHSQPMGSSQRKYILTSFFSPQFLVTTLFGQPQEQEAEGYWHGPWRFTFQLWMRDREVFFFPLENGWEKTQDIWHSLYHMHIVFSHWEKTYGVCFWVCEIWVILKILEQPCYDKGSRPKIGIFEKGQEKNTC